MQRYGPGAGHGENSLRTVPRNFPGRSGVKDDLVFLCSPETATAAALTGVITDPRDLAMPYPKVAPPEKWIVMDGFIEPPLPHQEARKVLIEKGEAAHYLPTGHLVYAGETGLMAVPFDAETLEVGAGRVTVLDDIRRGFWGLQFAFADDGTIAYVAGGSILVGSLAWVDRNSAVDPLPFAGQQFGTFQVSPDGTKVAAQIWGTSRNDIWIYDLERGSRDRLTIEGNNTNPVWSPNGDRVAFWTDRPVPGTDPEALPFAVMTKRPAGGEAELLRGQTNFQPEAWSPDGQWIAGLDRSGTGIGVIDVDGPGERRVPIQQNPFNQWGAAFSPNGRFVAYTSDESGGYQVYVEPSPPTGDRWSISRQVGSEEPVWSPSGDELYYRNGSTWRVVKVSTEGDFARSSPETLFEGSFINPFGLSYDVHPDGRRFLVIQPQPQPPPTEIRIVQNFFEELKRLVPTE